MKLNRIKFAKLVGWLSYRFNIEVHDYDDLAMLDQLTDIDVTPVEVPGKADPATLNELMRAIHAGEWIAAIKAYRNMTGYGLKEAKDAVDEHWELRRTKQELYAHLNDYTKAKSLTYEQDNCISTFIANAY